jgi:hypothetical protein
MTASPNDLVRIRRAAFRFAAALLGPLAASASMPAWAQGSEVGKPVPLIQQPAAKEPAREQPAKTDAGETVQVERLGTIDPSAIGLIEENEGGFGLDMWRGISRSLVETLLPRLPVPTDSPALRSLARRLLVSTARVPEGPPGPVSLLSLRIDRLFAAGEADDVRQLLKVAPPQTADRILLRSRVDSLLLAGDTGNACGEFQSAAAADAREVYWLKGLGFCKALAGDHAQAAFATQLMRDAGDKEDAPYAAMLKALAGDRNAKVETIGGLTALHFAMLQATKQKLAVDALGGAAPAVLAAIARSVGADLDVRLVAAERAVALGALKPAALAEIYKSVIFTPEELADAPNVAKKLTPPRAASLLFQVASIQEVPLARAEALALAFKLARERDLLAVAAAVNIPAMKAIAPVPELAWFAAQIAPALYLAGEVDLGRQWFAMVQKNTSAASPDAAAAILKLLPSAFVRDAKLAERWDGAPLALWASALKELQAAAPDQQREALMVFTLFEAVGLAVPAAAWEPLFAAPFAHTALVPAAHLIARLRSAAAAKDVGATVLLALLTLGSDGLESADPVALGEVVRALRVVGLEQDARAIAFEAMVARNLI